MGRKDMAIVSPGRRERLPFGWKKGKEIVEKDRYPTQSPFVKMSGLIGELNLLVCLPVSQESRLLLVESGDLE